MAKGPRGPLAAHRYVKIEIRRMVFTVDKKIESNTVLWERILDSAPIPKQGLTGPKTLVRQ